MNVAAGSNGAAHLAGQTIRGLKVIQRMPGTPWRWECKCTVCGTSQIILHAVLLSWPTCANERNHRRQETADDFLKRERAEERRQAEQRARDQQEQADRKSREQQEQARRRQQKLDAEKQAAEAQERAKAQQEARGRHYLAELERQAIFDKYQLSDAEIREVMNDESVTADAFDDPEQNRFHIITLKVVNQRKPWEQR